MNIQITIKDEARLIAEFRAHMMHEARRAVADSSDRVGKQFAQVTFPQIEFQTIHHGCATKIEWV